MKYISLIVVLLVITINAHAGNRVGGGGVFFVPPHTVDITDGSTGETSLFKFRTGEGDFSSLASRSLIEKLKKLGVDRLVLESGETIDLNAGGEGVGN